MKFKILCFLFFSIGTIYSQSKEETIDYLNQKFTEYRENLNQFSIRVDVDDKGKEYIGLFEIFGHYAKGYKIYPKEVYVIRVYRAPAGNYNLMIIPKNGINQMVFGVDENDSYFLEEIVKVNEINLVFSNTESSGNKMKKAITHLINIMGGDIAKDDLFED